jgi:hypothetical protein
MSGPMPFELTDAAIERMLAERAGRGAPSGFVPAVMDVVDRTPQRQPGGLPAVRLPGRDVDRLLLVAAVVALIAVTIAVAVVGGQLFRSPDRLVAVPIVSHSAAPSEALATAQPAATPVPSSSPSPTPTTSASTGVPVPNSPLIVYAAVKGHVDVFTLDPATGRRVTMGTLQERNTFTGQHIQWATDRQHAIVFDSSDSVQAIVDVAASSIDPLNLPPPGGRHVVSPDGERIASLVGSTLDGLNVVIWNLDGDELVNRPLPEIREGQLRMFWSPDGSSLLVNGCGPCDPSLKEPAPDQHYHLFRVPVDGGPIQPLLDEPNWVGAAAWSPDGSAIAFENACPTDPCEDPGLSVVRVADNAVTRLTVGNDSQPVWSPDGRQIAFIRFGGDAGGVYVMDADGGNVRRLTTSSTAEGAGDRDIHWSPDGRSIAFSRIDPDFGDVYLVTVAGGRPRLLVKNAVADW